MKIFAQPGDILTLTAPYTRLSGEGALVGSLFGVACSDVTSAVDGQFATRGVFSLTKVSTEVWVVGQKVYWDNTNKRCSNVPSAGFRFIGVAVAAAANPTASGSVRLADDAALFEDDSAAAAASHADAAPVTVTAAELLGRTIVVDCTGAGRTYTLPTAALLVAAIPSAAVGDIVDCLIVNGSDAAETITLAAGTGGGFDTNQTAGSRIIPQNASKLVRIRLTNVTLASEAYVVYA